MDPASTPAERLFRPFQRFAEKEASGGLLLLLAALLAMLWANSPFSDSYDRFWHTQVDLSIGALELRKPILKLVNDGLMAVFFFVVGLEIKRELLYGELSSRARLMLPLFAAFGGMAMPAVLYSALNAGGPGANGWGIPMATDIAFALGVLALLGPRVPVALKVFLTAVAILDDIGAVVVIAAFYSEGIELWPLAAATVLIGISAILNLLGFRNALPYGVLGVLVWLVLLRSGVHTTIGGVLLALTMPSRRRIDPEQFAAVAHRLVDGYRVRQSISPAAHDEGHELTELIEVCHRVQNPLQRFEHALLPWTVFFIMPVFALANAGVPLDAGLLGELAQPVTLGILLGLVVGKPLGILATCWLGVRLRIASLPDGVRWGHLLAVGCLCGIGFTMSLFIASLGFAAADLERQARLGVLAASLVAAVFGAVCMRFTAPLPPRP